MPELPEVEITCLGIKEHVINKAIHRVLVRNPNLRWPVPSDINKKLKGQKILSVLRRAKYILMQLESGYIMLHLGMSGNLRVVNKNEKPEKHSHIDVILADDNCLRFTDHRRFGSFLWTEDPSTHKLIRDLGPEPLSKEFNALYLASVLEKRSSPIKNVIMDNKIVVGVGNIYATEALFLTGILPQKKAKLISKEQIVLLVNNIKKVLKQAIKKGGTTFRDFKNSEGKPGYFTQSLKVYNRAGKLCYVCNGTIESITLGQRTSSFCPNCQD